ncbi:MAG: glutamine--fructose-6-phosphate transaminase (isomerizing) [Gammaproteobacteria bacterium]|jgi:glucosamine--fructose-6-phosphate aminotransferase (isomerizing)|nr:glutamine--fructose-6-phosphate transaminase (isomerizing) [Gammaproteobacteria bacterium]
MCGIVGVVAGRNIPSILLQGLQRLEYRGYDSSGVAVIDEAGELSVCRRPGKVQNLLQAMEDQPIRGKTGIAHTRWATHGIVNEANSHPHSSGQRVSLVHNGIIENHNVLRDELKKAGYVFASDTDSEVVVHLIDSYLEQGHSLLESVRAAIKHLEGAFAIAAVSPLFPDQIVAARLGCPLVVGKGIDENYVASDVLALNAVTDRFIFLEEGDLVDVKADSLDFWNVDDESVVRASVEVQVGVADIERGNYRHFMQKEIFQQPQVVIDTLEGRIGKTTVLEESLGLGISSVLDDVEAVTIVACGTSFYAASVARYWIEELADIPCQVEIASEFRYRQVARAKKSLFITLSQSGETADTLAALRKAKESGFLATLTFCNVATSSIVRESDFSFMLHAGTEVGVASTKAFTAQLVDLLLLAILLGRRNADNPGKEQQIVEALHNLPSLIESVLGLDDAIASEAERFIDKNHSLFLGRGSLFPIAMEGALKLKEISYIHAEGYAAGELKHGPLALVDEKMPVVAVAPNDELLEKLESNLHEVRARGGELLVFAETGSSFKSEPGVRIVSLPAVDTFLAPIAYTIVLQLLAYHVAVHKGTDVDQPRNLAKSVTVE